MKKKKVLVIDRSRWLRGGVESELRRADTGHMCCLGFDAIALGLTPEQINNVPCPSEVIPSKDTEHYLRLRSCEDNSPCNDYDLVADAIGINDNHRITDTEREPLLREVFLQLGYDDVIFEG